MFEASLQKAEEACQANSRHELQINNVQPQPLCIAHLFVVNKYLSEKGSK